MRTTRWTRAVGLTAVLLLSAGGTAQAVSLDDAAQSKRDPAKPKKAVKAPKKVPPKTYNITQHNLAFDPDVLKVKPGDTVIWTNREGDDTIHSVVQANGSDINSPDIPPNTTFTWTFTEPFEWEIMCRFHPDMHMTIDVAGKGGKNAHAGGHTVQPPPPAAGAPGEPTVPGVAGLPIAFDPPRKR